MSANFFFCHSHLITLWTFSSYFEYERPLDFVSRAERRKVMKEAAGDEDMANKILLERQQQESGDTTVVDVTAEEAKERISDEITELNGTESEESVMETDMKEEEETSSSEDQPVPELSSSTTNGIAEMEDNSSSVEKAPKIEEPRPAPARTEKKVPSKPPPPPPAVSDEDIFDALDMDI